VAVAAPAMMSAATGEGLWLDEIGEYYNVKRRSGELDSNYGARITAEAVRPKSNGIAIEMAVKNLTGQDVTVSDSTKFSGVTPSYDSTIFHNGAYSYSNVDIPLYGLFDLQYNFDLESEYDVSAFVAQILELVAAIRAAGTHLRPIIANGYISDELIEKPSDPAQALVTDDYIYDGSRTHDGSFYYAGVAGETEITDRPRPILRYYLPQNSKAGRMNSSLLVTLAV